MYLLNYYLNMLRRYFSKILKAFFEGFATRSILTLVTLGQAWTISRVNLENLFRNTSRKSVKVITKKSL